MKKSCVCQWCNKTYIPKQANRNKYGSRECGFKGLSKKRSLKAKARLEQKRAARDQSLTKRCEYCGATFKGQTTKKRYCSVRCCGRAAHRRNYVPKPMIARECFHCGKPFETKRSRFCSKRCGNRHNEKRREARERKAFVSEVSFDEIVKRDGGTCQLCGREVSLDRMAPDPLSPVLDHILPLACGGTHEPKNTQLAHFLCNSRKGARGADQLRLI